MGCGPPHTVKHLLHAASSGTHPGKPSSLAMNSTPDHLLCNTYEATEAEAAKVKVFKHLEGKT